MISKEVIWKWIDEVLELDLEEQIFLPMETKDSAQRGVRDFKREFNSLHEMEPEKTGTIKVAYGFRDGKHWIILTRTPGNPLTGFAKKHGGKLEKITLKLKEDSNE